MTFTIRRLAGHRALVTGTDVLGQTGTAVLDTDEWDRFKAQREHSELHKEFDATVEAFYAPLIEAAEKLQADHDKEFEPDPLFSEVVVEGVEGVEPVQEVRIHLSKDSAILKLIEQGSAHDRLVWVNDSLEILETGVTVNSSTPSFDVLVTGEPGSEATA
jgi:hypothetical protein